MAKEFEAIVTRLEAIRNKKEAAAEHIYKAKVELIQEEDQLKDTLSEKETSSLKAALLERHNSLAQLSAAHNDLETQEQQLRQELETAFATTALTIEELNDRYPILFFPMRIETGFSNTTAKELWIRIFPDDIAVHTHEDELTESEIEEGKTYWRAFVDATNTTEKVHAWDLLSRSFGAPRAAWIALKMTPTSGIIPPGSSLIFPTLLPKPDSWTKQPYTNILPDKFLIKAYANDNTIVTFETNAIPDVLKLGIDPLLDPLTGDISFDQKTVSGKTNELTANPDVRWMIDFNAAIANGMGAKIPITTNQYNLGFKKILVMGVKSSLSLSNSQTRLQDLLNSHHYTDGLSLLKQGTPTNNTASDYSGYSAVEFENKVSFATEREFVLFTPTYTQKLKRDGQLLCEALGIDFNVMQHIFHADGKDISNSMHMGAVLYHAALGYSVNELLPIFGPRSVNNTELKRFFSDYIRGRGALPSIRSGTQPYGILPATVYSRMSWSTDPAESLIKKIGGYAAALDTHWASAVASMESSLAGNANITEDNVAASAGILANVTPGQQLSDVLSLHAVSTGYVQRIGVGAGYVWNNLSYAALQHGQKRTQWSQQQTGQMNAFINSSGLPLTTEHKGVQMNYLPQQVELTIPLVAVNNVPLDSPLPAIGGQLNMLEVLQKASFDQLRDEDYSAFGVNPQTGLNTLRRNMLYRLVRQSLMLEFYEAACEILNIPEADRKEAEYVNIAPQGATGQQGAMGKLSFGRSRLQVMATPFQNFASIGALLSSQAVSQYPQAASLLEAKDSLLAISKTSVRDLTLLTAELIDTVSYRLDTWRLSLVNQRLNSIRGIREGNPTRTMGLYLGAYGWVTNVKPTSYLSTTLPTGVKDQFDTALFKSKDNKGFIHAPSINQAAAGAVMLSGYTARAKSGMEDPLSVNLSSERIRAALDIMDALKNGQQLAVLLGYEFERKLREVDDSGLDINTPISNLRKNYPVETFVVDIAPAATLVDLIKSRSVVNGAKLVDVYKTIGITPILDSLDITTPILIKKSVEIAVNWIWNLMDAVGDIALSEGLFHIVQGNPVKGGALPEAVSKGKLMAEPDIIQSVKAGLEVPQRLTHHFQTTALTTLPNNWTTAGTGSKRRNAEPYVNKWLCELLPAPANIICEVIAGGTTSHTVTATLLGLQPIDLMYLIGEELNNDDAMLSLYIKKYIRKTYSYAKTKTLEIVYRPSVSGSLYTFADMHTILLYARKVITTAKPLTTHDFMVPTQTDGVFNQYNVTELTTRLNTARTALQTARTALQTAIAASTFNFTNVINALFNLSYFDLEQTVYEYIETTTEDKEHLKDWAASVLALAQIKLDNSIPIAVPLTGADPAPYIASAVACLKSLFGKAFVPIPLFAIRAEEQTHLPAMISGTTTLKNDHTTNDLLMEEWLGSIAKVKSNAANYEMLTHIASAVQYTSFSTRPLIPVQFPYATDGTERWMGAMVNNAAGLKEGRVSIGACFPPSHAITGYQAGILIEEWIDVIPHREQTTGIGLHHNQPNAKAPQALILGVTPTVTGKWKLDDLVDMLNETFELAKKRGVDYERIATGAVGQLPGLSIPFTAEGNVIGLSSAHITAVTP